jgi:hypothetical protein
MTAKIQLKRIYILHNGIEREARELARLEEAARSLAHVDLSQEKVAQSRPRDILGDLAVRIADLKTDMAEKKEELAYLEKWAKRAIGRLEDETHVKVLVKRYLHMEEWDDIAYDLNYSRRSIFRWHGEALQALQSKMALGNT